MTFPVKFYNDVDFQNQGISNLTIDLTPAPTGNGNAITNLDLDAFKVGVIDPDPLLGTNSDGVIPTQKAVKAYVDGLLGVNNGLILKGGLDASLASTFPSGDAGDTYKVTDAGTIQGIPLEVGDTLICFVDGTAAGTPANWIVLQTNIDKATDTSGGFIELATQTEVNIGTDTERAVTPATLAGALANAGISGSYINSFAVADWQGASAPFFIAYDSLAHGLGTQSIFNVVVSDGSSPVMLGISFNEGAAGTVTMYSNIKFDGNVMISK